MKIFLFICLTILILFFILRKVFYSAKSNLFRDQEIWSGKELKIKRINTTKDKDSDNNDNLLSFIAEESQSFLKGEEKKDNE
tara:strand:+ start:179 stop:424 length:246 start_codon:yes stop_codon:yes gene_type:complete